MTTHGIEVQKRVAADRTAQRKALESIFVERSFGPRVHAIAVHRCFAQRIATGEKTLEVRGRRWPYAPGWLAIYASKKLGEPGVGNPLFSSDCPSQAIVCLVWVSDSWRMAKTDAEAACISYEDAHRYAAEPWVWELGSRVVLPVPIPLAETGWKGAPQNIVGIEREKILDVLELFICGRCSKVVGWEDGGADDHPGACSACWVELERDKEGGTR